MSLNDTMGETDRTVVRVLRAAARQRCPACLEGRVFSGALKMNESCPLCGHRFERAPGFFVGLIVGSQYPATVSVAPVYGIAALSNALLNLWISYFVGRGEMRVGVVLALAVVAEVILLVSAATDALSVARIVLLVALATQAVAIATFLIERSGQTKVALTPR